ncbi:MAG: tripartite tricarboxylate transporter substrate binding protein, partial [Betaproteobacteria bacterium]|nr:tripartite tricarboxylate transporter substrate binding protein [Betaproteobacteria bacterium]
MQRRRELARAICALTLCGIPDLLSAQTYPNKPIRLVVASAPGGGTDFNARVIAPRVGEGIGQTLVIDNRGGAGGTVGSDIVAKSLPDGYTLLMVFVNFAIHPSLYPKLPYDPVKDFAPITTLSATPLILVVNPKVPAKSVGDLIALAKAPGSRLNYAAPGAGSPGHLAGELFKSMTGISMTHVPYKGGGPSIGALIGGEVQMYFSTMPAALAQVKAGRLRALAVTSARRAASEPNIPTIAESGVPGYDVNGWFGVLAPAKTPRAIVTRLNAEFVKALKTAEVRERFTHEGLQPLGGTPEALATVLKNDIAKWGKVVR